MGWDDMGTVISAGESNLKYRNFNPILDYTKLV